MGFIRGGIFVILSVLFFISLILTGNLLTLSLSLEYDVIKPELSSIITSIAEEHINLSEIINKHFESMQNYCENNSEYVFNEQGQTFVIPCERVSEGHEAVVEQSVNQLVEETYYDDFDCDFWDCFKTETLPFFLVSQKAQTYWNKKFYLGLIASIILLILMFFLITNKTNLPFVVGGLVVISSFLFMKLDWVFSLFSDSSILQFFNVFVSKSYTVFIIFLLIGIAVLILGIILKLFKIGFKISKLFSKSNQPIQNKKLPKEIPKSNKKGEVLTS